MAISFRKGQAGHTKSQSNKVGVINIPSGVDLYKPERAGTVSFIIVPYIVQPNAQGLVEGVKPGDKYYERSYHMHSGFGADGKDRTVCLNKTYGERCPICEDLKQQWAAVDREDADAVKVLKELGPKSRSLFNIWIPDKGTKIKDGIGKLWLLDISYHTFTKTLYLSVESKISLPGREFVEFFADDAEGSVLHVNFAEKAIGSNKYYEAVSFDFDPHGGLPKSILDQAIPLDDLLATDTYASIAARYFDVDEEGGHSDLDVDPDTDPEHVKAAEAAEAKRIAAAEKAAKEAELEAKIIAYNKEVAEKKAIEDAKLAADAAEAAAKAAHVKATEAAAKAKASAPKAEGVPSWIKKGAKAYVDGVGEVTVHKVGTDGSVTVLDNEDEPKKVKASTLVPSTTAPPVTETNATTPPPTTTAAPAASSDEAWDAGWGEE